MRISRHTVTAVTALALLGLSGPAALAAESTDETVIDGVVVDVDGIDTSAELQAYLESDASATIVLDSSSGEVASVTEGQSPAISSRAVNNVCKTGNTCLVGPGVPFANYGFTDTASGWWTNRTSVKTGSHKVNVTFSSGVTSVTLAKNKTVVFTAVETVTKVKLR